MLTNSTWSWRLFSRRCEDTWCQGFCVGSSSNSL